jgi:hypothetical protein
VTWIKHDVYPREGVIHAFQAPFIVQEHQEKTNPFRPFKKESFIHGIY